MFAKCLGKKTYFTGGIDSLDADYVSTRSYRIQVLFFKLCYWISNSCIVVSQSDLKNIVKCLSSRKKLSYSEHAIDTRLFISDIPKENLFTSIVWMGNEGNVRRKGVDKALQVFAELKKIPAFADYRFIIIGRKGEGVAFIQSIINKYGLNDSIELIGEVSEEEKIAFLKRSKYYFQLSELVLEIKAEALYTGIMILIKLRFNIQFIISLCSNIEFLIAPTRQNHKYSCHLPLHNFSYF